MKISLYKLNKLVQDYPMLRDIIEKVEMIEYHGDMSRQSIVRIILKEIPEQKEYIVRNGSIYEKGKEYGIIPYGKYFVI
jgi:hypothetical protein